MEKRKTSRLREVNQKYPGVTFLKSKINIDGKIRYNKVLELSDLDCRKLEQQEANKRIKRRTSRQTRRQKERIFRYNLERAFDLEEVEVVPVHQLKEKITKNSFSKRGQLSSFPLEFQDWVMKAQEQQNIGINDESQPHKAMSVKSLPPIKKLKQFRLHKKIARDNNLYSDVVTTLKGSKVVNLEAGTYITGFMNSIKGIKENAE